MATTAASRPPAADTLPREHHDLVLILGYTSWAGAARRGRVHAEDRLTLELLDSRRVGRLLVCNPYRSLPAKLLRTVLHPGEEPFPESAGRRLHEPTRLRRTDPTGLAAIARSCNSYERRVQRAAERFGMQRPAVICTHPLIAGFGSFDWAGPVTYYANDDLTAFPPLRRWWPAIGASFTRLRSAGRRAVALTQKSMESIGPAGPAAVIPCGIEPAEWTEPSPAPSWFLDLPRPRLLYVGTLDERIDVDAVRAAAEAQPDGSLALVGPVSGRGPGRLAELRALPQVTVHETVRRSELAGLVGAADAGLIPHVRSEQTEAMSPLKLYEYVAAGIPVAAIDLPGVRGVCPERTVLASTAAGFGAAVDGALALGGWPDAARRRFIEENSWRRRFDRLLDLALASGPGLSLNHSLRLTPREGAE